MRTKRQISINNSLSHGICNCNCRLCGVNKPNYRGPKEFQSKSVTRRLIQTVNDSATEGVRIAYIANAGDGEPTLHPDFPRRMDMFGDMIRTWSAPTPPPEVSVVTNAARLSEPAILDTFTRNPLTLIISFPTSDPAAYGDIMACDSARGESMLQKVVPGIEKAMQLRATGALRKLQFHISPPVREVIRRDFPRTVDFLASKAAAAGLDSVEMIMFPSTTNRSGLILNKIRNIDLYRDLFRQFDNKRVHGVTIRMKLMQKRFFPRFGDLLDLIKAFDYPCIWNSQLFITSGGDSICCNDQAVRHPLGNILQNSIRELIEQKETFLPGRACQGCDQGPHRVNGSIGLLVFRILAVWRLRLALRFRRTAAPEPLPADSFDWPMTSVPLCPNKAESSLPVEL